MQTFGVQLNRVALLSQHPQAGWRLTRSLLKNLIRSDIGGLLYFFLALFFYFYDLKQACTVEKR
jgi:hypothetical protein